MTSDRTMLGDICKSYESTETERKALKDQVLLARLDGRAFHTYTQGLDRPFDQRLSAAFAMTASYLVQQFNPNVAYTQSDEISLAWSLRPDTTSEFPFGGRFQKLASILAASASVYFNEAVASVLPEKANKMALFDCRVWAVDTTEAAADTFLWRQQDAIKNAVSMAASAHFSFKALQGKHTQDRLALLKAKGIDFEAYPYHFKRGSWFRRRGYTTPIEESVRLRIPEDKRPEPGTQVQRSRIEIFDVLPSQTLETIGSLIQGAS